MESNTLRMQKSAALPLKDGLLRCLDGPDSGQDYPIPEATRTTAGTATDNDIVLSDETVSRHHVEFLPSPDSFLLRDLGSTNGTFVDGVQVREAHLRPNTTIRMGSSDFQFIYIEAESTDSVTGELCGISNQFEQIRNLIKKFTGSPLNVLITGETGTGKELVAAAIHRAGPRRHLPFIVVDCGTIPEHLMESELFGHERGSFTGATSARKGAFEEAGSGTIFLDEIGEVDLQLQPKLLRVLESREFKRIGSSKSSKANFRIIAATNRNLKQAAKEGRFRQDLYYRLSVLEIAIPPLRQRPVDIPHLVNHFLSNCSASKTKTFSPDALSFLMEYSWPGNIRQLRNIIERSVLLAQNDVIDLKTVADLLAISNSNHGAISLAEIEKAAIFNALKATGGNKSEAARNLGIAYSTLFEKIKKYGL